MFLKMQDIFWQFFKERFFCIFSQLKLMENLSSSYKMIKVA
jgi:hypothetical protein